MNICGFVFLFSQLWMVMPTSTFELMRDWWLISESKDTEWLKYHIPLQIYIYIYIYGCFRFLNLSSSSSFQPTPPFVKHSRLSLIPSSTGLDPKNTFDKSQDSQVG